ncbi:MAG: ribbon-helix-helix domain-containing protein [Planctomycetota bacterium]
MKNTHKRRDIQPGVVNARIDPEIGMRLRNLSELSGVPLARLVERAVALLTHPELAALSNRTGQSLELLAEQAVCAYVRSEAIQKVVEAATEANRLIYGRDELVPPPEREGHPGQPKAGRRRAVDHLG